MDEQKAKHLVARQQQRGMRRSVRVWKRCARTSRKLRSVMTLKNRARADLVMQHWQLAMKDHMCLIRRGRCEKTTPAGPNQVHRAVLILLSWQVHCAVPCANQGAWMGDPSLVGGRWAVKEHVARKSAFAAEAQTSGDESMVSVGTGLVGPSATRRPAKPESHTGHSRRKFDIVGRVRACQAFL